MKRDIFFSKFIHFIPSNLRLLAGLSFKFYRADLLFFDQISLCADRFELSKI
ncbi:hypothetical protein CAMSH0001_2276 [Campylobacter showae RM3277]|uniref:Uncharacterized protein n=1 Tax=Campylobacter showae RM3277 TaxID=553219 RepID=C6RG12_9BACT|nr:hypothetical protein CAMSH0001_2276 [Campylobacter showae RM3277]